MTGITKCDNTHCPLLEWCHRATVPPGKDQVYNTYDYECEEGDEMHVDCEYFEHNHKRSFLINRLEK